MAKKALGGSPGRSGPSNQGCPLPPLGWWCSREIWHDGPCAARPYWWNLMAKFWLRGFLK